jgi:hypothetical protein
MSFNYLLIINNDYLYLLIISFQHGAIPDEASHSHSQDRHVTILGAFVNRDLSRIWRVVLNTFILIRQKVL